MVSNWATRIDWRNEITKAELCDIHHPGIGSVVINKAKCFSTGCMQCRFLIWKWHGMISMAILIYLVHSVSVQTPPCSENGFYYTCTSGGQNVMKFLSTWSWLWVPIYETVCFIHKKRWWTKCRGLTFPQRWLWGVLYSGIECHVVCWKSADSMLVYPGSLNSSESKSVDLNIHFLMLIIHLPN